MRSFTFIVYILLMIFRTNFVSGQSYSCGNKLENSEPDVSFSPPCFDVDEVLEKCIPVYIKINLHFFVDESCHGKVQQMNKNQDQIYKIAEEMIEAANHSYAHNEAQWQVSNPVVPCVPIRLVLKGIYTHCKSNAIGIYNTIPLNQEFGVNPNSEFNFYIAATSPDGASGIGYHNSRCGSATAFNKDTWWTIGNFVHELGHMLTLKHSFELFDGCSDTPVITYEWDKNCDGVIEYAADPKLNEVNLTCWNKLVSGTKPGDPSYSDINANGVHDCDEVFPCTECPCCKPEFHDNNVMSYSAAKSALTTCQVRRMLKDLSGFNCSIIEKIGDCPPTSAFITQTPEVRFNQSDCSECLILEASVNEKQYELKIFEMTHGTPVLVYQSGLKTGAAINFCYRTGAAFKGMPNYLKPDTEYLAQLMTKNECSDSEYSYTFKTNNADCGNISYEILDIRPNPGMDLLYVEFSCGFENDAVQGFAKNLISGNSYTLLQNQHTAIGNNILPINISNLPQGTYILYIQSGNQLYQNNFLKL